MKFLRFLATFMPAPCNAVLGVLSAALLILAFPDLEFAIIAYVALVPLLIAVSRERLSVRRAFAVGWIFGTVFFFGTCWWLTFAPITYAGLPWPPVYFLMLCAAAGAGLFPALFAAATALVFRRFGIFGTLAVPVLWVAGEFLRMWLTGNNWNALGYALAFSRSGHLQFAALGGVYAVSFAVAWLNSLLFLLIAARGFWLRLARREARLEARVFDDRLRGALVAVWLVLIPAAMVIGGLTGTVPASLHDAKGGNRIVAVQPNVPMSGLTVEKYESLIARHLELAGQRLDERREDLPTLVVFPESPMMFQYGEDEKLRELLRRFSEKYRTAVLLNSAEVSAGDRRVLNSAVMINDSGAKVGQYDKIFLLPFGEYIPFPEPVASWMPAFVGNFKKGNEYDLLPVGDARAGVMICFESHFGGLSAEYARNGADVLIEMTNDGYLGKTPVLRQHLANAVLRAVETRRPVVRVTNVGITAFIDENGAVHDALDTYAEASRIWNVARSDRGRTPYVRAGDTFAWIVSFVGAALAVYAFLSDRRRSADRFAET
jgi:apolipoprotein N-acyltransferase